MDTPTRVSSNTARTGSASVSGEAPEQVRASSGCRTGLTIDREGIIYVADRENGRIQRFDLEGRYLGEWNDLGKTFSITVTPGGDLWIGTQPHNVANGVEPWLVKVDRKTGKIIGCVESKGHHSVDVNSDGEPLTGARPDKVVWFRSSR